MKFSSLVCIILCIASIVGCTRSYPEDPFIGTEKWMNYASDDEGIRSYDLGSVRRTGAQVLFNSRTIRNGDGIFLLPHRENILRKQAGMPMIVEERISIQFNCERRTVRLFGGTNVLEDDSVIATKNRDMAERPLRPNVAGEKVFEALCIQ